MAGAFIIEVAAELLAACKRVGRGLVTACHRLVGGLALAYRQHSVRYTSAESLLFADTYGKI